MYFDYKPEKSEISQLKNVIARGHRLAIAFFNCERKYIPIIFCNDRANYIKIVSRAKPEKGQFYSSSLGCMPTLPPDVLSEFPWLYRSDYLCDIFTNDNPVKRSDGVAGNLIVSHSLLSRLVKNRHKHSYRNLIAHEIFHNYHEAHCFPPGQPRPVWLKEGLANLVAGETKYVPPPSSLGEFMMFYRENELLRNKQNPSAEEKQYIRRINNIIYINSSFALAVLRRKFGLENLRKLALKISPTISETEFASRFLNIYGDYLFGPSYSTLKCSGIITDNDKLIFLKHNYQKKFDELYKTLF